MRKLVQVSQCAAGDNYRCIGICDDGTAWELLSYGWQQLPSVPQPNTCAHSWVDARNSCVESGEVCVICGAIRPGNAPTDEARRG